MRRIFDSIRFGGVRLAGRLRFMVVVSLATVMVRGSAQDVDGRFVPEAVDLGLSVDWAACNVGDSVPEGFGYFLAWAEVAPKEKYTLQNCRAFDRDNEWLEKRGYVVGNDAYAGDMSGVVTAEHDAAQALWGDGWRMPSVKEFQELWRNTTKQYTTLNDVPGFLLTSKVPGYTDRSIFIPAAGYLGASPEDMDCGEPADKIRDSVTWAYFWTRDYFPTDDVTGRAWSVNSDNVNGSSWYDDYRYYGFNIRAVRKK